MSGRAMHGVVLAVVVLAGCGVSERRPSTRSLLGDVTKATPVAAKEARTATTDKTSVGLVAAALGATAVDASCRPGMVSIDGKYCIDRYEASLIEMLPNGDEKRFSPFSTITDQQVKAVSEPNVFPQGYISRNQAERACVAAGKRLCNASEWQQACRGPDNKRYGYGDQREPGRCNDKGRNPVVRLFGFRFDATTMNKPQLNQLPGTLAKTGERRGCSNGYGVYDMVGNLHEWVEDPTGTFYGGYYQDVASVGHGDGCGYRTTAHEARYHDYSTGFRCCADPLGAEGIVTISPPVTPAPPTPPPAAKPKRP